MFSFRWLFFIAAIAVCAAGGRAAVDAINRETPRTEISLNAGWRFFAGDEPRAAEPDFDDAGWQAVDLPHTWNARDGEDGGNDYRRGAGWYRRHVRIDPPLAGRRLYLQFDGASLMADVWVNGRHLGRHVGGFARFRFDATEALKAGADNVVAVRVDNGRLGIPPISADFTFFGGLYRGVSLLATDPVQISAMDYGSPGVYIVQKKVTPGTAELEVRTKLENHSAKACDVELRTSILDAGGAVVCTASKTVTLGSHGAVDAAEPLTLAHPHLWNGLADPYLYTARVELYASGRLRDAIEQPLGVRFFHIDPDHGFFLNGHYLDLHGVNRHQDRIDKGWAISEADEAEDFAIIRELGCTAVRVSHYQQSDTWYQRCDKAGVVVWAEIPFVNEALGTPEFLENAEQQLRELIRQNYNHPSIFFWSVGNETKGAAADHVIAQLAAVAHEEDPTRLSTLASNHPADDPQNWHTDVVGFNRYNGWYNDNRPISDLAPEIDRIHADHPRACFGFSEYGAGASIYQHEENPPRPAPKGPFHPEEYQAELHEAYWAALKTRPFVWGKFIWCMFDFASDGRNEGDHSGRNDKGLVTYDRKTRKDAFYFYKANWSDEPVLYITSRRFTPRTEAGTEIKIYANAPEVEVSLNGVSLGRKASSDHIFRWPAVKLAPGGNRVVATAVFGAGTLTDSCTWAYDPPPLAKAP